jgi:hypothetical protein
MNLDFVLFSGGHPHAVVTRHARFAGGKDGVRAFLDHLDVNECRQRTRAFPVDIAERHRPEVGEGILAAAGPLYDPFGGAAPTDNGGIALLCRREAASGGHVFHA